MSKEEFDQIEEQCKIAYKEREAGIIKQLDDEEKAKGLKEKMIEAQARSNFKLAEKTRGSTDKQTRDHENALDLNRQTHERLKQNKRDRLMKEMEEKLEIEFFGKKWGRLEARELAYGPNDAIVIELKQKKHEHDRQLAAEMQKHQRPSLENPHKLETVKGKYTEHFNDNDKDRTR